MRSQRVLDERFKACDCSVKNCEFAKGIKTMSRITAEETAGYRRGRKHGMREREIETLGF